MARPSAHRARREVSAGCYRLADRLNEPQHWGLLTSLVKEFGLKASSPSARTPATSRESAAGSGSNTRSTKLRRS